MYTSLIVHQSYSITKQALLFAHLPLSKSWPDVTNMLCYTMFLTSDKFLLNSKSAKN